MSGERGHHSCRLDGENEIAALNCTNRVVLRQPWFINHVTHIVLLCHSFITRHVLIKSIILLRHYFINSDVLITSLTLYYYYVTILSTALSYTNLDAFIMSLILYNDIIISSIVLSYIHLVVLIMSIVVIRIALLFRQPFLPYLHQPYLPYLHQPWCINDVNYIVSLQYSYVIISSTVLTVLTSTVLTSTVMH